MIAGKSSIAKKARMAEAGALALKSKEKRGCCYA